MFVVAIGLLSMGCATMRIGARSSAPSSVACRTADPEFARPVDAALQFASADKQRRFGLPKFDFADVRLVADERVCQRISEFLGPVPNRKPATFSDVIVVSLGPAGYWVAPRELRWPVGEFECSAVLVDTKLRTAGWLCG